MTKRYTKPRILVVGGGASGNVARAGGAPVATGYHDEYIDEGIKSENIHGLLLLGGGDVNPTLYGAKRDATVYGVDDMRDLVEMVALDGARERGIPIMGICRGAQIMTVHGGGKLHVDIERDARAGNWHHGNHRVEPVRGSRLAKAWRGKSHRVVSIHHQAVATPAEGMVVSGIGGDKIVEAVESVAGWELGVQFHPEMAYDIESQRIFDSFVAACAKNAGIELVPQTWAKSTAKVDARGRRERESAWSTWERDVELESIHDAVDRGRRALASRPKVARAKRRGSPVKVSWKCFTCGIPAFDHKDDYVDHMTILHGEEVELR